MERASAPALSAAEDVARTLLFESLSQKQKQALQFLAYNARSGNATLNSACVTAAQFKVCSEPTCRRVGQRLRKLGLIECGAKTSSRGARLRLTPLGEKLLVLQFDSSLVLYASANNARCGNGGMV